MSEAIVVVHFVTEAGHCTVYRRRIKLNQRRQVTIYELLNEDDAGEDVAIQERPTGLICGEVHHV